MKFDQRRWGDIVKQWDGEDADQLESDKDAMDLADPKTWADQDAKARLGQAFAKTGVAPSDGPDNEPDAGPDDSPPSPAPQFRLQNSPATAGAGQEGGPPVSKTPAEPAAPLADPSTLDWKGLAARLSRAESGRSLARAGESMFANIGAQSGYKPNEHAGEADVALAKQPLELAKAKQEMEHGALANQQAKAGLGVKAAMNDPNSMQSQKAREAIKSFFGATVPLPTGFDNWSANDVGQFANSGTLAHVASMKNAQADDAAKKAAAQQKAAGEAETLAASRKNYATELKALGVDPATASQKDIDRAIQIGHNKATEAEAAANNRRADAAEGRKANEDNQLKQGIPFGKTELKYTGHGTPRADDVNEAQKVASLYGAAIDGMDDLQGKIDAFAKHPSPATKDAVSSAARIVGGHLNTAFGQGAMSKDEAEAMSHVLGSDMRSAAGVQAFIDKLVGDDPAAAQALTRKLKAARESTSASALGKLKTYRFSPAGGGEAQPDGDVFVGKSGKKYRKTPEGYVPL